MKSAFNIGFEDQDMCSNEALDFAIVQCLILFARCGRRIRIQKNCQCDDTLDTSSLEKIDNPNEKEGQKTESDR